MRVRINTSFGEHGTIKTLSDVLQKRMLYMRESARDSVAAMAINVLKSIRTVTKVAKKSSVKVEVKRDGALYPSITSKGKNRRLCVRMKGTNQRYVGDEKLIGLEKAPLKTQGVYRFTDEYSSKKRKYLIVAPSMAAARNKAKQIAQRRAMAYAGLAKRAIGVLMYKTNTKKVNDGAINPLVENKADDVTWKSEDVRKNGESGTYILTLFDNLRYAIAAIKGGKSTIDTQMKKAANKIVSIINHKLKSKKFLGTEKIETPFPEVRQRRKV